METIQLHNYRYGEILREIANESIEIILDRDGDTASKTLKEWVIETKHYFITVNISATEKVTYDPGDYETEPTQEKEAEIHIELISIHLDETKIIVGDYKQGLVDAIESIINVC